MVIYYLHIIYIFIHNFKCISPLSNHNLQRKYENIYIFGSFILNLSTLNIYQLSKNTFSLCCRLKNEYISIFKKFIMFLDSNFTKTLTIFW